MSALTFVCSRRPRPGFHWPRREPGSELNLQPLNTRTQDQDFSSQLEAYMRPRRGPIKMGIKSHDHRSRAHQSSIHRQMVQYLRWVRSVGGSIPWPRPWPRPLALGSLNPGKHTINPNLQTGSGSPESFTGDDLLQGSRGISCLCFPALEGPGSPGLGPERMMGVCVLSLCQYCPGRIMRCHGNIER